MSRLYQPLTNPQAPRPQIFDFENETLKKVGIKIKSDFHYKQCHDLLIYNLFNMQAKENCTCRVNLMTCIHIVKFNQQCQIDVGLCGKLENLKREIQKFLLKKEKEENKSSLLYYFNATSKQWIKTDKDYQNYLRLRKSSNQLDLYSVPQIDPISDTFDENAKRLIQTYKWKGQMPNCWAQRKDEIPHESWQLGNWLKWGQTYVNQQKYNDFRLQVDSMFSTKIRQKVVYKSHEMTDDLLSELESFEPFARRYGHVESGLYSVLLSIYSKVAEESGYRVGLMDKSWWKLSAWKESNIRVESSKSVKNFRVTQISEVVVPTISSQIQHQNCEPLNIGMFYEADLSPEDLKLKYISLDRLHSSASLFLKNEIDQEQFRASNGPDRIMSDDQVAKFVQEVAKAKAQYYNKYVHKIPKSQQDGMLLSFDDDQKVGILGDWGSGLPDAFDLLDQLVLRQGATIVLHLGDVYYAGFPQQFKRLSDKIKQLRTIVPKLRYYTVPGNHDFYTNGGPFYDSLNNYNDDPKLKQQFGFFCLRNQNNTVQYIGLDTGFSDSGTFNEIDPKYQGPYVYPEELAWAKEKINGFKGQTILLTHHQAFSPYEKIIGALTSFGTTNQQINPKLCEQFFEFLPKVDVWYWGHEHKLNFFKPNAYGIPCTRLLGNSSFQVHHPETYNVKFPNYNPVIAKYNPGKNDKQDPSQPYFDHTGAVMTFSKAKINVTYIDMTSSYLQPSKETLKFSENITPPVLQEVICGKPYRVKDACGLSYCYNNSTGGQYIWLNYQPFDLIFEKADQQDFTGPITSGMELYVKVAGANQYLYLTWNSYVKTYPSKDPNAGKFKFVNKNGSNTIKTGDSLMLKNITKGKEYPIGRYYYVASTPPYYCLATGSSTEYTSVQIYDPSVSNTDLPQ